jgi:hypothetical protein
VADRGSYGLKRKGQAIWTVVDLLHMVRQKPVVLRTMLTYAMRPHEWGTQCPAKGKAPPLVVLSEDGMAGEIRWEKDGKHNDLGLIYLASCNRENLPKSGNEAALGCVYLPSRSILRSDGGAVHSLRVLTSVQRVLEESEKVGFVSVTLTDQCEISGKT